MRGRDEIEIERQATFGEGGEIETSEEPVETDLTDWEVIEVEPEQEVRYLREKGCLEADTRTEVGLSETEQGELFIEAHRDQMTLDGGDATGKWAWSDD